MPRSLELRPREQLGRRFLIVNIEVTATLVCRLQLWNLAADDVFADSVQVITFYGLLVTDLFALFAEVQSVRDFVGGA